MGAGAGAAATSTLIVDTALNPLAAATAGQMLGFIEPPAVAEALSLRIYLFLIEIIRTEDLKNGDLFVKRFLEGPQQVWADNQARIFAIKDLWDVVNIPDDFLIYLKHIVGWTRDLDKITDALDNDTLRRLIRNAVALWKIRGTEDAMVSILTLLLGARLRSWNWFDFRWISDETGFGHDSDGFDPWNISITNDRELNVRIMDDGTINRQLVIDVANLFRPTGERVEIVYLKLLDLFRVAGDDVQWDALGHTSGDTGSDVLTVSGGTGTMTDDTEIQTMVVSQANVPSAQNLSEYMVSARLRGELEHGVVFHWLDQNNFYAFVLTSTDFRLVRSLAGSFSTLVSVPHPFGFIVDSLLYYMFRAFIVPEGATNRIICYVDGMELINATDATFPSGEAGVFHDIGGTVEADEVEVLGLPIESDFVDINS